MLRAASLGILMTLAAASPALASEAAETPLARAPSDMTGDEIAAYNVGRAANSPDYIRCRRIEQIGSLVRKSRVCHTNAEWRRITDKGNQDARDTLANIERGHSNSLEPADQIGPQIRPQ